MRIDKFTQKGQEAVLEAQNLAQEYNHPAIEPEHLLKSLLIQDGGVIPSVLLRIGADGKLVLQEIEKSLTKMPRASGASIQIGMSNDLVSILEEAEKIAKDMKDEYTSTEHLLLAMVQPKAGHIREILKLYSVDYNSVLQALASIRGSQRVTSPNPETQYEVRPEFLNRVDEIVVFHRLNKNDLQQIAEIQLEKVHKMLAKRDMHFTLSTPAKDLLIENGYDPLFGARPLKRVIQKWIVDPIALRIIEGDVQEGDNVHIKTSDEELVFSVNKADREGVLPSS